MIADMSPIPVSVVALFVGGVLGVFHFTTLRMVTNQLVSGASPVRAILLQIVRMALVVAVLAAFTFAGALPLLSCALGVLLGRAIVLRRAPKEG